MAIYEDNRNITKISEEEVNYYGYLVKKNGDIFSKRGKLLHPYFFSYPYSHVTMHINGKDVKINRAALIYELFSGQLIPRKNYYVSFRDENTLHASFDNLYLISKCEYNKKIALQKNRKIGCRSYTDEEAEEIRKRHTVDKVSLRKLSQEYGYCVTTISKICNK